MDIGHLDYDYSDGKFEIRKAFCPISLAKEIVLDKPTLSISLRFIFTKIRTYFILSNLSILINLWSNLTSVEGKVKL